MGKKQQNNNTTNKHCPNSPLVWGVSTLGIVYIPHPGSFKNSCFWEHLQYRSISMVLRFSQGRQHTQPHTGKCHLPFFARMPVNSTHQVVDSSPTHKSSPLVSFIGRRGVSPVSLMKKKQRQRVRAHCHVVPLGGPLWIWSRSSGRIQCLPTRVEIFLGLPRFVTDYRIIQG